MSFWMFKTTDLHRTLQSAPSAVQVAKACMEVQRWGIGQRTPHAFHLKSGDRLLIYAGGKRPGGSHFLAHGKVHSGTTAGRFDVCQTTWPFSVRLEQIKSFSRPVAMKDVLERLSFYKLLRNKAKWGVSMMGGIRSLTKDDFDLVMEAGK